MTQSRQRVEADYVTQARQTAAAQKLRKKWAEVELAFKRAAALSMNSSRVREFEFEFEDGMYHAKLCRPHARRISPQKLYTLVKEGEISLDDFLECVTADKTLVAELIGEDRIESISETYRKGLDLIIKPVGD